MAATGATIPTPYRKTHVIFDLDEPVTWEPPFAQHRAGAEINASRDPATGPSHDVGLLASGAWALTPIQESISNIHERADVNSAIIPLTDLDTIDGYKNVPLWRFPSDLTGLPSTPPAGVNVTGDNMLQRRLKPGDDWSLSHDADMSDWGQPPSTTENVAAMTRHAVGTVTYPADQPFFHRFRFAATEQHAPDYVHGFAFGGPATVYGHGQYYLAFTGSGIVHLWEKFSTNPYGPQGWFERDHWRYTEPHRTMDFSHTVRIWPHRGSDSGYIEFQHSTTDLAPPVNVFSRYVQRQSRPLTHLFSFPMPTTYTRSTVTGEGPIRIDVRPDQRPKWQPSLLRFPSAGLLVDLPMVAPFFLTPRSPLTLYWTATTPEKTSVVGSLVDAATNTELSIQSSGPNFKVYATPNQQRGFYTTFKLLTDDVKVTPFLWSYQVIRDGVIGSTATTPFEGGLLQRIDVSGPEADPSHETASVTIEDVSARLTTLLYRASMPVQIETEYDPHDDTLRSVLFRGYVSRADALKKGLAGSIYPSPDWRMFEVTAAGHWQRLNEAIFEGRLLLADDPNAAPGPNGQLTPYKVTDVVRTLLSYAGYASDMIDVPDSPIRFFPSGAGGGKDDLMISPLTNIGEWIPRILRDYLGAFLLWDSNAGTRGGWRVMFAPLPPYNNLAAFQTGAPVSGLPHRPESYGSANWVGAGVTTFIRKRTLRTFVKPPEANFIVVIGAGGDQPNQSGSFILGSWAANLLSYNALTDDAGNTIVTADPSDPDFLGRRVPLFMVDPNLNTQEATDWVCRRLYGVTAHAIKMAVFDGPLVLVWDVTDLAQRAPRPLRYYDPVLINGVQWLVRSCNPSYTKDGVQFAHYEMQAPSTL